MLYENAIARKALYIMAEIEFEVVPLYLAVYCVASVSDCGVRMKLKGVRSRTKDTLCLTKVCFTDFFHIFVGCWLP